DLQRLGEIADEAVQRAALAERARDDVVLAHLGLAPVDQLDLVVDGLVLQRLDDDDVALARLHPVGELHLARQTGVQRDAADLVELDLHVSPALREVSASRRAASTWGSP